MIYHWDRSDKGCTVPEGRLNRLAALRLGRPYGTPAFRRCCPSDKSLGYFRVSLRDKDKADLLWLRLCRAVFPVVHSPWFICRPNLEKMNHGDHGDHWEIKRSRKSHVSFIPVQPRVPCGSFAALTCEMV